MLTSLANWVQDQVAAHGLTAVFVLMVLESACIPIPSEVTMVYAGYLVSQGDLVFWQAVLVGAFANLVGSWIAWGVGAYWRHVWESLLAAGSDLGAAAFGVEAQRIMRLEKGHFIVGQDTDGLTQAHAAGLDWLVKLDKDDFIGKPELVWEAERGDGQRLVGLQPADPGVVPPEGCQIVEGAVIVGRITSSRLSPTLGRSICLGHVAARLAEAGTVVTVRLEDGTTTPLTVMAHHAHFDPEGTRLRG